jgi:hypothetical protein
MPLFTITFKVGALSSRQIQNLCWACPVVLHFRAGSLDVGDAPASDMNLKCAALFFFPRKILQKQQNILPFFGQGKCSDTNC